MVWEDIVNLEPDVIKQMVISANNKSVALYRIGDFLGSLQAIEPALQISNLIFENFQNRKFMKKELQLDKVCGHIGDIYGELNDEENALKYYECHHFMNMQIEHGLDPTNPLKLYQFRKFTDYNMANLMKHEISLSKPSVMNDIVDTLIFTRFKSQAFGRDCYHTGHLKPFKKSHDDYRIASFCSDNVKTGRRAISNSLMWAHYAEEHRGYCIEFIFDPDDFMRNDVKGRTASRLFRMTYIPVDKPFNFNTKDSLTTRDAFMTKSGDWEYEQEVRLLQYKRTDGSIREQYLLSPKTRINAIYFGVRYPESTMNIFRRLIKNTDVKFYKMKIDTSDVYNLKYDAV